jgi:hypothetical protein
MPGRMRGFSSRPGRLPGPHPGLVRVLFAQVTNIRDQVTGSDTLSFTLDNFKPYVQRVEVSQSPFYPKACIRMRSEAHFGKIIRLFADEA